MPRVKPKDLKERVLTDQTKVFVTNILIVIIFMG